MTTKMKAIRLIPSLILAAGILLATYLDKHPLGAQGDLVSAVTMVTALLGADAVDSLFRYGVATVSWATMIMGSGFLLATWIFREAGAMGLLIPSMGAVGWVMLLGKRTPDEKLCKSV